MDLQVPVPVIDAAVAMRDLSAYKEQREAASRILAEPFVAFKGPRNRILEQLEGALYAAILIAYAQGMVLLQAASRLTDTTSICRKWHVSGGGAASSARPCWRTSGRV